MIKLSQPSNAQIAKKSMQQKQSEQGLAYRQGVSLESHYGQYKNQNSNSNNNNNINKNTKNRNNNPQQNIQYNQQHQQHLNQNDQYGLRNGYENYDEYENQYQYQGNIQNQQRRQRELFDMELSPILDGSRDRDRHRHREGGEFAHSHLRDLQTQRQQRYVDKRRIYGNMNGNRGNNNSTYGLVRTRDRSRQLDQDDYNQYGYLNEKNSRGYGRDSRSSNQNKVSNPKWKAFIHPDLDQYYNQLMIRNKKNSSSHKQFHTPKVRQKSEYTQSFSQNAQQQDQSNTKRPQKPHNSANPLPNLNKSPNSETAHNPHPHPLGHNKTKTHQNLTQMQTATPNIEHIEHQLQQLKKQYENKINVLEHQNNNLKDQLFYLRAAILAQYEAKENKSGSSLKSM